MKRAEIQNEARKRLRALNIIGIDQDTLKKAKAEISEESIPSESIPPKGIPLGGIPNKADVNIASNFCKVDIDVLDKALPTMDVYEQSVYVRLYRYSYGYGRNWCAIGYGALAKTCGITRNGVIKAIGRLQEKGWVLSIGFDRIIGTTYRVFLPQENGLDSKTRIEQKGVPLDGIPLKGIPPEGTQGIPLSGIPPGGISGDKAPPNKALSGSVPLKGIPSEGTLIEERSIDLSLRDIVTGFYKRIGQNRIAREKRERAEKVIKELQADGFNLEDIQFAVEWTPENAKEELYDFSIIKHTIGQAMAAKEEAEAKKAKRAEAERIASLEQEERDRQEQERAEIEAHKETLDTEARTALREKALKEIRSTDGIKEEFINDMLIAVKENEILMTDMPA